MLLLITLTLFLISNPIHATTSSPNTCGVREYLCEDGTAPNDCIPIAWMCDGVTDCSNSEDEVYDVCGVPCHSHTTTTTTNTPVSPIRCGQSYYDTASPSGSMTFSFALPDVSMLKISACHTENEGAGYFTLCQTPTSSEHNCVLGAEDQDCITAGCSGRPLILATVGDAVDDISANTEYTLTYYTYFSGTYKFSVECGSSLTAGKTGGGTCVDTYDPYGYPYYYNHPSSTYDYYGSQSSTNDHYGPYSTDDSYAYPNPPNPSSTDYGSPYDYYGYPDATNPSSTDFGSQQSSTYDYYGSQSNTNDYYGAHSTDDYYGYPNPPNPSSTDYGSQQSSTNDGYYYYYNPPNPTNTDEPTCDPTMGPVPSSPPVLATTTSTGTTATGTGTTATGTGTTATGTGTTATGTDTTDTGTGTTGTSAPVCLENANIGTCFDERGSDCDKVVPGGHNFKNAIPDGTDESTICDLCTKFRPNNNPQEEPICYCAAMLKGKIKNGLQALQAALREGLLEYCFNQYQTGKDKCESVQDVEVADESECACKSLTCEIGGETVTGGLTDPTEVADKGGVYSFSIGVAVWIGLVGYAMQ